MHDFGGREDDLLKIIIYTVIGVLSGIISGMGIGGGAILIPALTIFLKMNQQTAQNINLIYFIPTASIALITHVKNKSVEKKAFLKLASFGLLGAVAGAMIALKIDSEVLKKLFGGFLLIMGFVELRKKQ